MTNSHFALFGSGFAAAHVAGTRRQALKEKDVNLINGVSAKRHVLGQKVYNDAGEVVGRVDDLILTKRVVTYAIVGVGGFLGRSTRDVAVPVGKFVRDDDRIVLPGASKAAIRAMPRFKYAQITG